MDRVVQNARESGVARMLCVAVDLDGFPEIRALAHSYPNIYASVGVHPNTRMDTEPTVEELCTLANDPKVVAIGETGLDYFRSEGELEWQRDRFRTHIRASKRCGKPLIIHTREARSDVLSVLEKEADSELSGVMHCFVEDWPTAQRAMELGLYISFSGIVTFKSAHTVQEVARRVPLDRMLVETDSPYLAPVPHRGKQNQPSYVRHVADFIAKLRGISVTELEDATTANFSALFGVG